MTGRVASVYLDTVRVGELREDAVGVIEYRADAVYLTTPGRPVLGQWFEDRPGRPQRGERPGDLPSFFANLIPEGDLGLLLRERLGIGLDDDLGLLAAVGDDLPGAVVVRIDDGDPTSAPVVSRRPPVQDLPALRFSLAGVQLKFSMLRHGDRFVLPGRDARGDWIAKIAFSDFATLCDNEYVTMEWARRCSFDVPACELRDASVLEGAPHGAAPETKVFVIQRYDRDQGRRIHQEDFQQIVGRRPQRKYDDITYEDLAMLVVNIVGPSAYDEMVRRLTFVVASGNGDAHMKNWSVVYRDGVHAQLSPLYDQVFTGQWPSFRTELALNLSGAKVYGAIELGRFRELARRLDRDVKATERLVSETIEAIVSAWQRLVREVPVLPEYRQELEHHWRRVPLLAPHAGRIARRLVE